MAMANCFQALRFGGRHARTGEKFERAALIERIEPDRLKQPTPTRSGMPRRNGRLTATENNADIIGKQRNKHLAEPRVHQAEHFVGVKSNDDTCPYAAEARRDVVGRNRRSSGGSAKLRQKSRFSGFDGLAI